MNQIEIKDNHTEILICNKNQVGRPKKESYCKISKKILGVIIGTLLGDSYIRKIRKNYGLGVTHSTKQEKYFNYKVKKLSKLQGKTYYRDRYDKRTDKTYHSLIYHSKQHEIFNNIRDLMYENNCKIFNKYVEDNLTIEGIAVWYCDDGNLYRNKDINHLSIATNNFDIKSLQNILTMFKDKYNIFFKIRKDGLIRLTSKREIRKFINLIKEFIPKSMEYKICQDSF